MRLSLTKPLCFFDLETTGTQLTKDRIVQLAAVTLFPDGSRESRNYIVNPEIHIPEEITAIHGISNEMVQDAPKLAEIAAEIIAFMGDADLAGYNSNKFDIPVSSRVALSTVSNTRSTMDLLIEFAWPNKPPPFPKANQASSALEQSAIPKSIS